MIGGKREGAGAKPYQPTEADRNTVRSMAASGFKQEDICRCLGTTGLSKTTMLKYFRDEIEVSAIKANAAVASVVYKAAISGDKVAAFFWLKCRAGWKEVQVTEITGKDGMALFTLADNDRLIEAAEKGK